MTLVLLSLSLVQCRKHPALDSEIPTLQFIRAFHAAQVRFQHAHARYGSAAEVLTEDSGLRVAQARVDAAGYDVDVRPRRDAYEMVASYRNASRTTFRYRSFYCDQTGVVRQSLSPNLPTSQSPPIGMAVGDRHP